MDKDKLIDKLRDNLIKNISESEAITLILQYIEVKENSLTLELINPSQILRDIKSLAKIDIRKDNLANIRNKISKDNYKI